MFHELPLVIFTVLQQSAIGAFFIGGALLLSNKLENKNIETISKRYFFILALMGIAMIASTFHLGSPTRAFNALNKIGHSWLSNEIGAAILFMSAGGLFWLVSFILHKNYALRNVFLFLAITFGILLLYAMCKVYMIDTVPSWDNIYTPLSFTFTALVLGSIATLWLTNGLFISRNIISSIQIVGIISLIINILIVVFQMNYWTNLYNSITSLKQIFDSSCYLFVIELIIMLIALVLLTINLTKEKICNKGLLVITVLMLIAELIARMFFYAAHMTVGLA